MSLCHAIQKQKLLCSLWFGVLKADFRTCLLLRRSVFFTDTGSIPYHTWSYHIRPRHTIADPFLSYPAYPILLHQSLPYRCLWTNHSSGEEDMWELQLQNTKSGAWEQFLLLGFRAKAKRNTFFADTGSIALHVTSYAPQSAPLQHLIAALLAQCATHLSQRCCLLPGSISIHAPRTELYFCLAVRLI